MLNCCIERKRARDEARKHLEGSRAKEHKPEAASTAGSTSAREPSLGKSWDSWSDSEDEFFECLSDQGEAESPQTDGGKPKADGRLHPYNNLTLLKSREPLYVPVTQVPELYLPSVHTQHCFGLYD